MLKQIQGILEKEKFECSIIQATEKHPQDRLLIFLGLDAKKREQILEITAQQQVFQPDTSTDTSSSKGYFRIQFQHLFPFSVDDMALNQVGSLILFLNHMSDFPGLDLDELDSQVSYRYVWLAKATGIDAPLVISLVGNVKLTLELFAPSLERLASGETTFNALLQEVIQIAKSSSRT